MELKPEDHEQLTLALAHAFPTFGELNSLTSFAVLKPLAHITHAQPVPLMALEILQWADSEGCLGPVLIKAIELKPRNPKLRAFMDDFGDRRRALHSTLLPLAFAGTPFPITSHPSGTLQALVVPAGKWKAGMPVRDLVHHIELACRRICRIDRDGSPVGTGFLIGDQLVMTNAHVVSEDTMGYAYTARFDGGKATAKVEAELSRSAVSEFDFSILKLEDSFQAGRGYYEPHAQMCKRDTGIQVVQHSGGGELAFAFGIIADHNTRSHRIAYTANTAPGSSGSPIFNSDWQIVGIHHQGDEGIANHGIPMHSILAKKNEGGFGSSFFQQLRGHA